MDSAEKRVAGEFPKRCGCCSAIYLPATWGALTFAYELTDVFGVHEARHCPCGTTLMVVLKVLDLSAE